MMLQTRSSSLAGDPRLMQWEQGALPSSRALWARTEAAEGTSFGTCSWGGPSRERLCQLESAKALHELSAHSLSLPRAHRSHRNRSAGNAFGSLGH